ncbi:MAG: alpha/beta hydrolase [Acidiferrobacterales bacterium]|nr:alpha/beta hydrolase [Acidiferrobacterales bacterium]
MKQKIKFLFYKILFISILSGIAVAQMGPSAEPTSDLEPSSIQTYKTVNDRDLKLHIFYPENHEFSNKQPALLYFHGGGFRRGSPIQGYEMSEVFNPKGVVLISVEYRMMEQVKTIDNIIADAKSSVRFVRTHAHHLGIDPKRIVAVGHSAGGYLAYAAGAIDKFDEAGENLEISSLANAMVPWSMGAERSADRMTEIMPEGTTIDDFQPATYVKASMASSLFITGSADQGVPLEPLQALQENISSKGNTSSVHVVDGAEHGFSEPGQKEEVYATIADFMASIGFIE